MPNTIKKLAGRTFRKLMPSSILRSYDSVIGARLARKRFYQYLSSLEGARLMKSSGFQRGNVQFLDRNFMFTHAGSFLHSYEEIFVDNIYDFPTDNPSPLIIDCGANIGLSVLYFKRKFTQSHIIAFEPDKEIFEVLAENVRTYNLQDVILENKAVWTKAETLSFFSEGALAGSITTDHDKKDNRTTIEAVDILDYLSKPVDFLKIDIEGAENILLPHIADNLKQVKNLFLEYHSDKDEPQQLGTLLDLVRKAGFRYYIREAATLTDNPYKNHEFRAFDLQLNIFCYRP